MAEYEPGHAPSTDPALLALNRRIDGMGRQIANLGPQLAKALSSDEKFMSTLAELLIRSDTVTSAIVAAQQEPKLQDAPTPAPAVDAEPIPSPAEMTSPTLPTAVPIADPEALQLHYRILPKTRDEPATVAAIRHDNAHPLFPNQYVYYLLMQNATTKQTFWQQAVDIQTEVAVMLIERMRETPDNTFFRCDVVQLAAPDVIGDGHEHH